MIPAIAHFTKSVALQDLAPEFSLKGSSTFAKVTLPILARMLQPQHVEGELLNFVAHLVVPDENPPYLARLEFEQPLPNPDSARYACFVIPMPMGIQ